LTRRIRNEHLEECRLPACATIIYISTMAERKRTDRLDWEDLRFFLALAESGTLSGAARKLRVNHATVARRIGALEASLGQALFDRRADGYALTPLGRDSLDAANAMEAAALAVLQRADVSHELKGRVRMTAPRVLADGFLIERLGDLHRHHPGLDFELISESRNLSLGRREAEIAIRLGAPQDGDLVMRRAGKIAYEFFASPTYRDKIVAGSELAFISYDEDNDFIPEAALVARHFANQRFVFRTDSQISQAAAARAGLGIALLPCFLAAEDSRLAAVSLGFHRHERDVFILTRRDLAKLPRIRAVTDYLAALFRLERARLEGLVPDKAITQ
jgi:DNA-binding transcriptional LysR family regulator